MINKFSELNFKINEKQAEKFEKYYELLSYYNDKFNITAITDKEDIIKKHFIDSILPSEFIKKGKIIDVGAGGGFPSIPLKIINEDLELYLLEATGKKCEFLKTVVNELQLKNVKIINGRAEDEAKKTEYREKFDFAVSRAVAKLNTLTEYCLPFVKIGGEFVAYKGGAENEIKEAENAVKLLGGRIEKIKNYDLFGAERNVIFIRKILKTEKKYPRGNGKERKNPL